MVAKNTVIQDGQTYYPGQEIWDLGSIKAVSGLSGSIRHYEGEQKDFAKLPKYVSGGSTCFMVDTGKYYRFDEKTKTWIEPESVKSRFVHADEVYAILNGKIEKLRGDVAGISSPLVYKQSIASEDLLPLKPEIGWVYNIESKSSYGEAGMNVAWNGSMWDSLGPAIDTTLFLKATDISDWAKQPQKPKYTAKEVGAIPKIETVEKTALDTNVTLEAGKYYKFPEMSNLIIKLGENSDNSYNEYRFTFTSGITPTTLTIPESVRSDIAVEANRVYEISIANNLLAWTSWVVGA